MARKRIGTFLSGGVLILCVVLLFTPQINAQITGSYITFTISGNVGVSGVTMNGLPGGTVMTDNNGFYTATVNYGWSGTVTPQRRGYNFDPPNKTYPKVTSDLTNEDYTGTLVTFTISGSAGMEGVEMNGLPGNPVTGEGGLYSVNVDYGWSGTVNPTKEGYKFDPPSKTYGSVVSNELNQNYTPTQITFPISGTTKVPGVVMKGLPGDPTTGRDGNYSVTVKYGFTGVVTPQKEGYEFSPPSMQYNDLISEQTNQDYVATQLTYIISGSAGLQGVELTSSSLQTKPVTDGTGFYSIVVPHGWSGTITPVRDGYTFTPGSITYVKVTSDRDNQSFEPTIIQLTISGSAGLDGVEMSGLPGSPVTTSGGLYSATVDYGWTGTVMPIKEGYDFNPPNKTYSLINRDQLNQSYTPSKRKFEISGSLNPPVDGVLLRGLPGNPTTGKDGAYTSMVEYGFTGSATPYKDGYEFDPPSRPYTELIGPEYNQNYTATLLKRTLSGVIMSDKQQPVEGVTVSASGEGGTCVTNDRGEYQLEVDHGWRGTVIPDKEGYTFKPPNKPYGAVTRDQPNQGYTAIMKTFTIKGTIAVGGTPVDNVKVTATNGGGSDTTNSKGEFTVTVPYNWTGEIVPTKEGLNFNPPSTLYASVTQNYVDGKPVEETRSLPAPQPQQPSPRTTDRTSTTSSIAQQPTTDTTTGLPRPTDTTAGLPRPGAGQPVTDDATGLPLPTTQLPDTTITEPAPTGTTQTQDMTVLKQELWEMLQKQGLVTGGTKSTYSQTEAAGNMLISNNFNNDTLLDVLQILATTAKVPIIPDETVDGLVTCDLKDVTLDQALEIVLAGTPYVVKKTPYYYLVCSGDVKSLMFPSVSETRRVKLNYVKADMAMSLLSTAFLDYVKAEPAGNTLVITAPPVIIERIMSDLKEIDQTPVQILLDARIVVIERGDLLNLGVEWGWPTIQAGVFSNNLKGGSGDVADFGGKMPWGVQIGYAPDGTFTNSLELALNLLAQNKEARILTKPQVFAQDGKKAQIKVATEEYYVLTSPQVTSVYAYSEMEKIESGTTLTITPHIGDNNDITLEMSVEVSDSVARGSETDLPVVTRRTAENTVRIKDGGTVAVAGLTENKSRLTDQRVPGLSKLPLIGKLFENTDRQNSTREIAVFVTAHIVPESYGQSQAFGFTDDSGLGQQEQQPRFNAPRMRGSTMAPALPSEPVERSSSSDKQGFREDLRDSLMRSSSY